MTAIQRQHVWTHVVLRTTIQGEKTFDIDVRNDTILPSNLGRISCLTETKQGSPHKLNNCDHPTLGDVVVTGREVHEMSENQIATWRGEHMGIIFHFFNSASAEPAAEHHFAHGLCAQIFNQRAARSGDTAAGKCESCGSGT